MKQFTAFAFMRRMCGLLQPSSIFCEPLPRPIIFKRNMANYASLKAVKSTKAALGTGV